MRDDCIFCKLANGIYETNAIYEDERFKVILDNAPATRGHALILPKDHYQDLYDMDRVLVGQAMQLAQEIAHQMKKQWNVEGLNIIQNNGAIAGQSVFHYHLHVIPRYAEDGQHMLWNPTNPSPEELRELAAEWKTFS